MPSPHPLFDRQRLAANLARRKPEIDDFVAALVLDDLMARLDTIVRPFHTAIAIGPLAAVLPDRAATKAGPVAFARATTLVPAPGLPLLDAENLALPDTGYDLIVSLLDLQTINDVPGYLARAAAHLAPDGLLLVAAIGGMSLTEIRAAWLGAEAALSGGAHARVAPMLDMREGGSLLQHAGLALPVSDIETHVVRYADPLAALADIKALGGSNPLADRPARPVTRTLLGAALDQHRLAATDPDGRVRVTLEIVWMSGWKPDPSQQKPLRPGSAKVSLRDVLGDKSGN